MSRVGRLPIKIPSGVKTAIESGAVHVEGPKGKLTFRPGRGVSVATTDGIIVVSAKSSGPDGLDKQTSANFGTARARINNMVLGVTQGWKRSLEMVGVGFNAQLKGTDLVLAVGFSHEVTFPVPATIKCAVTKTTIDLESADKELLGTFAAKVRRVQPPEPYLGKGIKYSDEVVRRKAGKTGKK